MAVHLGITFVDVSISRDPRDNKSDVGRLTGGGVQMATPEDVEELAALQVELVQHAATLLAPGGELHYAVCTLNPAENEAIAGASGMTAHDELRTWPDEGDDGFYAARLAVPGSAVTAPQRV